MATSTPQSASTALSAAHATALEWAARGRKRLFIDGRWMDAQSGRSFETLNPATEKPIAEVAEGDSADVDAAVAAARRAFDAPTWSGISPHARTRLLLRVAEAIDCHADELAAIEALDNGMPLWYARATIASAAELFRYYAGWPSKIFGTTNPTDSGALLYVLREPMGVCGQIIPWNLPCLMTASKLATALACGNTVVFKPAELAPLSSLRLAEIIAEVDLPPGVVNMVPGIGMRAGAAIAAHPGIDKIAFTGSTSVGKQILQASAGNLKKVTLELGGKSPNIVFADADLDRAIAAAVRTFCGNSGQVCSAGTRLFVQRAVYEEVVGRVVALAGDYKVGSPFAADTKLGPLISARQRDRVMSYIEAGTAQGANLLCGGGRVGDVGYFVEPTVFGGVANHMKIAQEEIFGPVLSIIPFEDENDGVPLANDSTYGLAAAVWTRDIARGHKVARALKSGRVWINTYGEADPVMAFGGYKQSGVGREYGAESIEAYTQTKAVLLRL